MDTQYNPFYNNSVALGVSSKINGADLPRDFTKEESKDKGDDELIGGVMLFAAACLLL